MEPLSATIGSENFTVEALSRPDPREERAERADKASAGISKLIEKTGAAQMKIETEKLKVEAKQDAKRDVEIEEAKKRPYLQKIDLYLQRFPWLQEKLCLKVGPRTSLPELVYVLEIIRSEMNCRMSLNRLVSGVDTGILFWEGFWGDGTRMTFLPQELRWDVTGMYKMWKEGAFVEDIIPILQEIDIEYPWLGRQTLPMRAVSGLLTMMAKANMKNKNPELFKKPPLPDEGSPEP